MARRGGLVGDEVALTARLLGQLPVAPAVVAVVTGDGGGDLVPPVLGMLAARGSVTVHVACSSALSPELAGVLAMYNQPPDALPEAVVEAVAAARRCGLTTAAGNCVLLFQPFVPAVASAVVRVNPAPGSPVVIDGRWGLTERRSAADTFVVTGSTVHETLARKTTASLAAGGGTHTVVMPVGWQDRYSIGPGTVRRLAAMARGAAAAAASSLALDIVLGDRGPVVLRCRPGTAGRMSLPATDI